MSIIMIEIYDREDWGPEDAELSYFSFGMFVKMYNQYLSYVPGEDVKWNDTL